MSARAPAMLRVFYAIWPDGNARERLASIAAAVARAGGGRPVAESNLHVTLAFIGSVAPVRIDALRDTGAEVARDSAATDLSLERLGGAHDGELVWFAPASVPVELVRLHARLRTALDDRGFATEHREFRPHLTLARHCVRRVQHAPLEPLAWRVTRLTLVASTTRAEGSQYRELAAWPLA